MEEGSSGSITNLNLIGEQFQTDAEIGGDVPIAISSILNLSDSSHPEGGGPSLDLQQTHQVALSQPGSMSTNRDLPIDVVGDILSRLEVKDVLRCKVISKPIYYMIKTPSFVYKHLHHSQIKAAATGTNIIVGNSTPEASARDTVVHLLFPKSKVCGQPPVDGTLKLIASCNGLLFLRVHPDDKLFLLWNPATREYRILPTPYFNRAVFGFGYDVGSDCYKVVKIAYGFCKAPFLVEVWSTITNTWTEIKDTVLPRLLQGYEINWFYPGYFLKGNLYWLACNIYHRGPAILISFAIGDYSIRQIMLPDAVADGQPKFSFYIGDVMGSLALFCSYEVGDGVSTNAMIDIWVMEDVDGKDSWSRHFSMGPFSKEVCATPACMNEKFLLRRLDADKEYSELFLYDPCTKKETVVAYISTWGIPLWSWSESLVSVKQNGDDREYTDFIDLEHTDLSDHYKNNLHVEEDEEEDFDQYMNHFIVF